MKMSIRCEHFYNVGKERNFHTIYQLLTSISAAGQMIHDLP